MTGDAITRRARKLARLVLEAAQWKKVQARRRESGGIAHSMGGLVARYISSVWKGMATRAKTYHVGTPYAARSCGRLLIERLLKSFARL